MNFKNNTGGYNVYDKFNLFKIYAILVAVLIFFSMFGINVKIAFFGLIGSILYSFFFFGILEVGLKFDEYQSAKKILMEMTVVFSIFSAMAVFMIDVAVFENNFRDMVYKNIALFFLIISLLLIFFQKNNLLKIKSEDFNGLLIQERMYDDIKLQLKESFEYRVIKNKNKQEIFAKDIDNEVVDIFQNIKPEILVEIKKFILMDEGYKQFSKYWLTILNPDDNAAINNYIDFLNTEVKEAHEDNKFYRYMYQLIRKKLDLINKEYDFSQAVKSFHGVVEYAIIDMFIYARNFKNIPMGNILAYANENSQSRHFYGTLNSITIESVGRYGIGIYVGYYLAKENLGTV